MGKKAAFLLIPLFFWGGEIVDVGASENEISEIELQENPVEIFEEFDEDMLDESILDDFEEEFDFDTTTFDDSDIISKPWRLAVALKNGVDLNDVSNTINRRVSLGLKVEQFFNDSYYVKLDGKMISQLPGDDAQTDQSSFSFDARLRDLFIQKSDEHWTLTAGFQTLTLGEMDAVQVSDYLSPWDYSESAFTSPEDARLGQLLINAQWYLGESRLQMIYSPWPLSNRYPGGDADTLMERLLGTTKISVEDNQPEVLQDHEILLRWQHSIDGSDISLLYSSLLSNDPIFYLTSAEGDSLTTFSTEYYRFHLISTSANYSMGNFLWKIETAYKHGMKYQSLEIVKNNQWDIAIGVDYDANGAWNMAFEVLNQHIIDPLPSSSSIKKNTIHLVTRWSKNWLHDTLSTIMFLNYQLPYRDIIASAGVDYAVNDNTKVSLVGSVFHSTDVKSPGQLTKDWDQIVMTLNYTY